MWRAVIFTSLILALSPAVNGAAGTASGQQFTYVVSYQGLFSAGVPMEIAAARVELAHGGDDAKGAPSQALLQVSTADYEAAELLYPVRYCYRSRLVRQTGAARQAEWWGRTGSELSRGRLSFDGVSGRVLRLETQRSLEEGAVASVSPGSSSPKLEREEVTLSAGAPLMDRLAMFWWLQQQPLVTGSVLHPAVSNGSRLQGYRIEVEGVEELPWQGTMRSCHRLRLEPLVDDDSEVNPVRLWLSRDRERLPLLLHSSRGLGSFEARLTPDLELDLPECEVPESAGLVLPAS